MPATIREHRSCTFAVEVRRLAIGHAEVWTGFRLQPAAHVRLALPGAIAVDGIVGWHDAGSIGVAFDVPLHVAVFGHLMARHAALAAPASAALASYDAAVVMMTAPSGPWQPLSS